MNIKSKPSKPYLPYSPDFLPTSFLVPGHTYTHFLLCFLAAWSTGFHKAVILVLNIRNNHAGPNLVNTVTI